jgi:hypothetical protein
MKFKDTFVGIICLINLLLFSCKKDISLPFTTTPTSFSEVFENFWDQMNTNYVYWDIDTTNWNKIYYDYKPIFAKLDINNDIDVRASIGYFKQITSGLIDSHYSINFTKAPVANYFIFPALDRKLKSRNFHSPYLYTGIDTTYLDKGFFSGTYATSDSERLTTLSGTIDGKILYFHCNRFALEEAYQSITDNSVKSTLQYFFAQLKRSQSSIKGVIIDLRNNDGGNISDLNFFMGHLINAPLHFGFTRYKSANGRLAYTPWIDAVIQPQAENVPLTMPIIALADNYTISLAEAMAMAIKALPLGVVVGETTWGATGPITANVLYNDGPFTVPGFLSVNTSSAEFKYINDSIYEGRGFPPDISVPFNLAAINAGKDLPLEKTISLIH